MKLRNLEAGKKEMFQVVLKNNVAEIRLLTAPCKPILSAKDIQTDILGTFGKVRVVKVIDSEGFFIANVKEGFVTGIELLRRRGCVIETWQKRTSYLLE